MRVTGYSYGASLAYPNTCEWDVQRKVVRAQASLKLADDLYVEEWETLPAMMRPAAPVTGPARAYKDGFITAEEHFLLTKD